MPHDLRLLHERVARLRRRVDEELLRPGGTRIFRLLGADPTAVMERFAEMEPNTHRVWNMQATLRFDPDDPCFELNDRSWRRGLDSLMITGAHTAAMHPVLMAHYGHRVWIGPVLATLMLIDDAAVVEGPRSPDGHLTALFTDEPAAVAEVRTIFSITLSMARPLLTPGATTLTARQIDVARGLARGWSDRRLSRSCEISQRTLEREIAVVLRFLGATSRTAAVMRMSGRTFEAATSSEGMADLRHRPVRPPRSTDTI